MKTFNREWSTCTPDNIQRVSVLLITSCQFTMTGMLNMHLTLMNNGLIVDFNCTDKIDRETSREKHIDNIIIDIDFYKAEEDILFTINGLKKTYNAAVTILTSGCHIEGARRYRHAGATTCIGKHMPLQEIQALLTKKYQHGRNYGIHYLEQYLRSHPSQGLVERARLYISLPDCEQRVIKSVLKGVSLTEFARKNRKSIKTVSTQKISAMKKLGVSNLMELNRSFGRFAE